MSAVNMIKLYFFSTCFFCFLTIIYGLEPVKTGCLEKEKALASLETAEILLAKAKTSFPSCKEDINSTDDSDCSGKKPLAYIEISKKLISEVRRNFPSCSKPITKDDKIVDDKVVDDKIVDDKVVDDKIIRDEKFNDCSVILASGRNVSGVYTIWPDESLTTSNPLQVYCDMETDHGGWTVIQRRGKYPVQLDFYKDWESYKNGFGNVSEEFWLGNENIRALCHKGCEIRFDFQDEAGEKGYAHYKNFNLSSSNYRISISGYSGNAGDDMKYHDNLDFSTKDKGKTDRASKFKGGWWYIYGHYWCNLNGIYKPGKSTYENVYWYNWKKEANLAKVEMKIKAK